MKQAKQPSFGDAVPSLRRELVPAHIAVIETAGKTVEEIVREMMAVPLDKSILLDYLIGYQYRGKARESNPALSEDQLELFRLQQLLNSRYHNRRFDFLGDGMISQMVRASVAGELWNPHKAT